MLHPTNMLFWNGTADATCLTNAENYVSDLPPLKTSGLIFSYLGGTNLNPVLGGELYANSLVFLNLKQSTSINGNDRLTIGAGGIDTITANHHITTAKSLRTCRGLPAEM